MQLPFTVIDFETTGFRANGSDRVIEVGLVRVSPTGEIEDTLSSLINPNRDLGPTHIHGLHGRDVINAPTFEEIAGLISNFCKGSVPVAHNAIFDKRFMEAEFRRLEHALDIPWLCTLKLCSSLCDGLGGRKLSDCCDFFSISLIDAHAALEDAKATAQILGALLCDKHLRAGFETNITPLIAEPSLFSNWPELMASAKPLPRSQVLAEHESKRAPVEILLDLLPAGNFHEPAEQQYLLLLDRVLEDRKVDEEELEELIAMSKELGLSRGQVEGLHHVYLKDLLKLALADNVITEFEQRDLETVRKALCIDEGSYQKCLEEVKTQKGDDSTADATKTNELFGKSVCFTGQFECDIDGERITREIASEMAESKGMLIKKGVTKKLDFLVAADPDSLSGKARKARDYGIRVIAEPAFWKMLGIY